MNVAALKKPSTYLAGLAIVGLAIAMLVQAASLAATRLAPETATGLMASNGAARARMAMDRVTSGAEEGRDPVALARDAQEDAVLALKSDPLLPNAHAVLALAASDAQRVPLIDKATQLQRRDLSLQGQALQQYLAAGDFSRSITTVDQILRVHPEQEDAFFPVLGVALANERSIPSFAQVLDGSSAWQLRFVRYALEQPELLTSLRLMLPQKRYENEALDKRLVWRLGAEGRFAEARAAYEQLPVASAADGQGDSGRLGWGADYWPFDWRFVSESGMRGQTSLDGERLEVFARPNKGGIVAERAVTLGDAPALIRMIGVEGKELDLANILFTLRCAEPGNAVLAEIPLTQASEGVTFDPQQTECAIGLMRISILARRAPRTLRAEIGDIELVRP